jgi:hypothetical protein
LEYDRIPEAIEQCLHVLAPGGRIAIVGPCIELAIQTNEPYWLLRNIIKHDDEDVGLGHAWTPTAEMTLRAVLRGVPLYGNPRLVPVETIIPPEWPNPSTAPWQCAIVVG